MDERGRCLIPETEFRGITLRQLQNVCREIEIRCKKEKWERFGQPINPEEVNLYDLNTNFLNPTTKHLNFSYVETIASGPQPPVWFVSHWWGEPVYDFVKCIEGHAFDRNLNEDTIYWVCAYANNQHDLGCDIGGADLRDCSFFRALKISKGVLSVVDRESICFTRIWCTFEIAIALLNLAHDGTEEKGSHLIYDVYTCTSDGGRIVGLTDGVVASDMFPRNKDGTLNTKAKSFESNYNGMRAIRQASFPPEVCRKALSICLESAEATVDIDKRRILNFIAGREKNMDENPLDPHKSCTEVNSLLRSKFALSAYRRVLETGDSVEQYRRIVSESPMRDLQISFHGTSRFKHEAKHFAMALPVTLENLDLKYSHQLFETSDEFSLGFGRLTRLQSFKLDCSLCTLTLCDKLWEEIGCLVKLQKLDLSFSHNGYLQSIDGLGRSITNLHHLEEVKCDFSFCSKIHILKELIGGLLSLSSHNMLSSLNLNFGSSGLSEESIIKSCESLAYGNLKVEQLSINFEPLAPSLNLRSVANVEELKGLLENGKCSCCIIT